MPDDLSGYDLPVFEELRKAKARVESPVMEARKGELTPDGQISQVLHAYATHPHRLSVEYSAAADHYVIMSPDKLAWVLRGDRIRQLPDWHPLRDLERMAFRAPTPEPPQALTLADRAIQWTNLDWLFDRCDPPAEVTVAARQVTESTKQLQEILRGLAARVSKLQDQDHGH